VEELNPCKECISHVLQRLYQTNMKSYSTHSSITQNVCDINSQLFHNLILHVLS